MEHTMIYDYCLLKLKRAHEQYGALLDLVLDRYMLYQDKISTLNDLEEYAKEKLKLDELSDVLARLMVAKKNCKIKMNRYKQININRRKKC